MSNLNLKQRIARLNDRYNNAEIAALKKELFQARVEALVAKVEANRMADALRDIYWPQK